MISSSYDEVRALLAQIDAFCREQGERVALERLTEVFSQIEKRRQHFTPQQEQAERTRFRDACLELILQSDFANCVYSKPRGYAGDFVTQEMIWLGRAEPVTHRYLGKSDAGRYITALTYDTDHCLANVHRIWWLRSALCRFSSICSVGCGSAIELWDETSFQNLGKAILIDQDSGALERAGTKIKIPACEKRLINENAVRVSLGRASVSERAECVYAFGLFDYFDVKSTARIIKGLIRIVEPGGCFVFTNALPTCPNRLWMEWGGDWYLNYKTQSDIEWIADRLNVDSLQYEVDPFGAYQYVTFKTS